MENEQKNSVWKNKVNQWVQACQGEIIRTTKIGKKMLSASRINSDIQDDYRNLGSIVAEELRKNAVTFLSSGVEAKMRTILEQIDKNEKDLRNIEQEVKRIKIASGPEEVSSSPKND